MDILIDFTLPAVRWVLGVLLKDRATGRNIIWATDPPEGVGDTVTDRSEITLEQLKATNYAAVLPRPMKQADTQQERTKRKGEVFTPAWVCCLMNNLLDEQWFRRKKRLFTTLRDTAWTVSPSPVSFPKGRRWQGYADSRRLEICCGEAPYLVSRYDASSGRLIAVSERIGLLDRKLRIVNEHTQDADAWFRWALRAFQSVYGYEYQGDNLLLARVNLLLTFTEYFEQRWGEAPDAEQIGQIADIISWNLWQMDGLKGTVPFGKSYAGTEQTEFLSYFGYEMDKPAIPCIVYNWRGKRKNRFDQIRRGKYPMKFDFVIGNEGVIYGLNAGKARNIKEFAA